jgi:hypothetical protein
VKNGVGCIKIIGSVKRYAAGNRVSYDDVRALLPIEVITLTWRQRI